MCQVFYFLKEVIPIILNFVIIIATVIASYVGLKGLETWRRQLRGNKEYNLAINALSIVYQLRDAINNARGNLLLFSRPTDIPEEKWKELPENEKEWICEKDAWIKRWIPVQEARAKLDVYLFEMEAVWGQDIIEIFKTMNKLIIKLQGAIRNNLHEKNPNDECKLENFERKEIDKILYEDIDTEKDEFLKQLKKVISDIDNVLKPYIIEHYK